MAGYVLPVRKRKVNYKKEVSYMICGRVSPCKRLCVEASRCPQGRKRRKLLLRKLQLRRLIAQVNKRRCLI